MTRIIAGTAKGRVLKVPGRGTRPTSDRVREAMFSSLEHRLGSWNGLCVYDLYAGSGAFGFESLSRGAAVAVLVEHDRRAVDIIKQNAQTTGLDPRVVTSDVAQFVEREPSPEPDLVFADPPYELDSGILREQLGRLLNHLPQADVLLVVERSARDTSSPIPAGCTDVEVRKVGDTTVTYAHWYGSRHDHA